MLAKDSRQVTLKDYREFGSSQKRFHDKACGQCNRGAVDTFASRSHKVTKKCLMYDYKESQYLASTW